MLLMIVFFSLVRWSILLLERAVGDGHQLTLPYRGCVACLVSVVCLAFVCLANLARGLFAPQVFAVISLFVPLRRIVRQHGSEYQAQISGYPAGRSRRAGTSCCAPAPR